MFRLNLKQNIVFCEAAVLIVLNVQQITVAKKEGIEFFPTAACVFTIEVIEGHTVTAKICMRKAFSLSSAGQYLVFVGSNPSD